MFSLIVSTCHSVNAFRTSSPARIPSSILDPHELAFPEEPIGPAREHALSACEALALALDGFESVEHAQRCAAVDVLADAGVTAIPADEVVMFHFVPFLTFSVSRKNDT